MTASFIVAPLESFFVLSSRLSDTLLLALNGEVIRYVLVRGLQGYVVLDAAAGFAFGIFLSTDLKDPNASVLGILFREEIGLTRHSLQSLQSDPFL